jgi:hypothetical protein
MKEAKKSGDYSGMSQLRAKVKEVERRLSDAQNGKPLEITKPTSTGLAIVKPVVEKSVLIPGDHEYDADIAKLTRKGLDISSADFSTKTLDEVAIVRKRADELRDMSEPGSDDWVSYDLVSAQATRTEMDRATKKVLPSPPSLKQDLTTLIQKGERSEAEQRQRAARRALELQARVMEHTDVVEQANAVTSYLSTMPTSGKPLEIKGEWTGGDSKLARINPDAAEKFVSLAVRRGGKIKYTGRATNGARAYAVGNHIELDIRSRSDTVVHELGHVIESGNPAFLQAVIKFRDRRTQGEAPQPIKPGSREMALYDRFAKIYTGKVYRDRSVDVASEITSTFLEDLYRAPRRVIEDTDFLTEMAFILGWGQ